MKRRRENKIFKKLINVKYLPILAVFLILGLSIGFSAFQETLLVDDMVANVRLIQDAKITSAQLDSVTNRGESNYIEVTDNTLSGSIKLPEETSTVTYKVEFKNLENVEVGILNITSDNDDIEVTSTGTYTLGDKVCDDTTPSKCTLGATKVLYITVGYSENGYDALTTDEAKEFTLTLDVEDFVSVTYEDISGSGYPTEVINGGTLEVDFDTNAPSDISITMDGVLLTSQEYTYTNGVLTIPNVDGDIVISYVVLIPTCTYVDNDSNGEITVGDKVSCPLEEQTDSFYVIEDLGSGSIVKMLAEWNLNVKEEGNSYSILYPNSPEGYQDSHVKGSTPTGTKYGMVKFDNVTTGFYGYWTDPNNSKALNTNVYTACSEEAYCSNGYPAYVYDSNATFSTFVTTYVGYINDAITGANAVGKLITYEQLISLGCNTSANTCSTSPATAPAWVYQTSYWTGSASRSNALYIVRTSGTTFHISNYNYGDTFGIRPVIEISASVVVPES